MTPYATGVFYHPSFSRRSYLTVGARLADFPMALDGVLRERPGHALRAGARFAGTGAEGPHPGADRRGEGGSALLHRLAFGGRRGDGGGEDRRGGDRQRLRLHRRGGHHSGRDFFGGYCCFNDVALCVVNLREKYGFRRFAILDTDAHHGDGTREIFLDDPDILHVCFCGREYESPDGTKVDVGYPDPRGSGVGRPMNDAYFDRVARQFPDRVRRFRPDLLFWYFGFDTHQGDYGDIGLTGPCYWNIALLMRDLAGEVCGGKLAVVLGGGSQTKLATYLIPPIIERLAGL